MLLIRTLLNYGWILITVILWGSALMLLSLVLGRTSLWWFAVSWFRVVIWGARVFLGIEVRVNGLENVPRDAGQAAVLLAKHQSLLETLLLPTLIPHPLAFVFKRELLRIPFFGWSMARLNMIHIDRASRTVSLKQVVTQGKQLLDRGTWIIMFPEGTRTPRGQKGTYQTAGTRLAVDAGAPVIPIAVASARCWPRRGLVKYPGVVDVSIGKPIPSVGREAKELMREVEVWIEAEMRRIDPDAYL